MSGGGVPREHLPPDAIIGSTNLIEGSVIGRGRRISIQTRWVPRTVTSKTVSTSRVDRAVSQTIVPYVRPIAIKFTGTGFRAYGSLTAYFDGIDVSAHIKPSGKNLGDPIIADSAGNVAGEFFVPPQTFRTGKTTFTLSDDPDTSSASSHGEVIFDSGGVLETFQATNTTTVTTSTNTLFEPVTVAVLSDPVAQTFFIDTKTSAVGCFITKIDLFFRTKDPKEDIVVEIRNIEGGVPGRQIIGSKTLTAADVTVSEDSSAVTTFRFDRPVYVKNKELYSVVIKANSTNYNLWVATLGEQRVDKNETVAKQPNAGVMLISSNDSTWNPDQLSDIKFKVYVAKFSTNPATVVLAPAQPAFRTAKNTHIETETTSTLVRVFALNHGLVVGSKTNLAIKLPNGTTSANGIPSSELIGAGDTMVTRTVTYVDAISFGFDVSVTTPATSTGLVKTAYITYEPNIMADSFVPLVSDAVLDGTSIQYRYKGTSGKSSGGSQAPYVPDAQFTNIQNGVPVILDNPKMFMSHSEAQLNSPGVLPTRIDATLTTSDPFVTPFVRLDSSGIATQTNIFNNPTETDKGFVAETSGAVGSALSKYVTKPITLTTPATSLKISLAGNVVTDNAVDVYFRTNSVGNNESLKTTEWTKIEATGGFVNSSVRNEFFDYAFEKTGLFEFSTFQVKLVMRGKKSSIPPLIKDLRIMALAV